MTPTAEHPYESIWIHLAKTRFKLDWIDAGGVQTRYLEAGRTDAPALIMIHGTGGSLEGFCANIAEHSKHFRCFAIDLVGAGFSDKPQIDYEIDFYVDHVRNFMRAHGLAKASFLGVSMGSWIISRLAIKHPELVHKLTMNAPFGLADDADEMAGIRTRRGNAYDNPSWENIKVVFDHLIFKEHKRIDDLIGIRQLTYQLPEAKATADHILNIFKPEILPRNLIQTEEWKKIHAPTLIVLSLKDRPMFPRTARTLSKLIPNSTILEMDNVGHWPQFEAPDVFNARNIEFLLEPA